MAFLKVGIADGALNDGIWEGGLSKLLELQKLNYFKKYF